MKIFFVNGEKWHEATPGDYGGTIVSPERVKRELGWEPRFNLQEGLANMIAKSDYFGIGS